MSAAKRRKALVCEACGMKGHTAATCNRPEGRARRGGGMGRVKTKTERRGARLSKGDVQQRRISGVLDSIRRGGASDDTE